MKTLNIKVIFFLVGILVSLNGGFMLVCALVSKLIQDGVSNSMTFSGFITLICGVLMTILSKSYNREIGKRESYIIVVLGWIAMATFATLPYLLTGVLDSFSDSFFEAVSGYTTTGSTVFSDVEILPKSILLWRSMTQWIGGMGIIVLTVAILPLLGIGGMQLFVAEAAGPSTDKLHPRIADTAKRLWMIYLSYTLAETILLWASGMSFFDAINHSMTSVSTGGFSTKNTSVGFWNNSPAVQYIIIIFMFLGGTNFILPYFAIKGRFRKIFQNDEFLWYLVFIFGMTLVVASVIFINVEGVPYSTFDQDIPNNPLENAFRHGFFQVVSVITTTGFITADFTNWTPFLKIMFFALMFLGASAGSTSGGMKIIRHVIMIKTGLLELKKSFHSNVILILRYNKTPVSKSVLYHILAFFVVYIICFTIGAFILGTIPIDFETALGASISSLGNIGPALGQLNPLENFSTFPLMGKWCCMTLMLLGRLELFTVMVLFTKFFWRD